VKVILPEFKKNYNRFSRKVSGMCVLCEGVGGNQAVEGTRCDIAEDTEGTDATESLCPGSVTR